MTASRVSAGVPTGGQFAASVHVESEVSLAAQEAAPEPSPADTPQVRPDRKVLLSMFASGERPLSVFGPDRRNAAAHIAGILRGIQPAPSSWPVDDARSEAFRHGVAFLRDAYYEYNDIQGDIT
ncbi:MAG: hypothetical protein WKF57_06160 [Nakamurella sp.]